ncbi:TetR/AcrR family transcriptional regulator [Actinomadura sp. WMMA1423]|uniref:TetR/AcrR family transcriptional regulator n=1 Tax=Actinomadura sp. WMMA1423 TaxID=2591108 RepID=UPI001F104F03|nr:TetR family transcriptional regulator [Actinomadura sp. WMMA1423]
MDEESERERIIQAATRMFAELGFDGTSGSMIAAAAGVDTAAVMDLAGGTLALYHTVMERAHLAELAMLEEASASLPSSAQGVHDLADTYLDFHLAHPHIARLWLHRWSGDAAGSADLELSYERPLTNMVADATRPLLPPDVDVDYMLWTLVWAMTGFVTYGVPTHGGRPTTWRDIAPLPDGCRSNLNPETVERFRSHLHTLIGRVLRDPGPPSAATS